MLNIIFSNAHIVTLFSSIKTSFLCIILVHIIFTPLSSKISLFYKLLLNHLVSESALGPVD